MVAYGEIANRARTLWSNALVRRRPIPTEATLEIFVKDLTHLAQVGQLFLTRVLRVHSFSGLVQCGWCTTLT